MKTAFVFPGQGSQQIKMLADFASVYPQILQTYQQASDALGYDVWALTQQDESKLNQTEFTQPALLTASVALWRLWLELGGARPDMLAGHSLGEYTALVCAEVLNLADAVRLVAKRGALMQHAVTTDSGAMAAILGLEDAMVIAACQSVANGQIVSVANFNSPGQVVIAGEKIAVDRAIEACKQAGAKRAIPLAVSVPSHCQLMLPAAAELAIFMRELAWSVPRITLLHNVDVQSHVNIAELQQALVRQLSQPVRWVETVQKLEQMGCEQIIECGPGKVLTGLNKRIVTVAHLYNVSELPFMQTTLKEIANVRI